MSDLDRAAYEAWLEAQRQREPISLWLDDLRPAPEGWTWVKTVDDAKWYLSLDDGRVQRASLDHDLGACDHCTSVEASVPYGTPWGGSMPHCSHVGTGYDLVCWMEETGHWPVEKPVVHSMNASGAQRMRQVIDKEWRNRDKDR